MINISNEIVKAVITESFKALDRLPVPVALQIAVNTTSRILNEYFIKYLESKKTTYAVNPYPQDAVAEHSEWNGRIKMIDELLAELVPVPPTTPSGDQTSVSQEQAAQQ